MEKTGPGKQMSIESFHNRMVTKGLEWKTQQIKEKGAASENNQKKSITGQRVSEPRVG